MSRQSEAVGGFGLGLLVGLAIGASVALLYAPNSGEKTRKLIRGKAKDAWNTGVDQMNETRKQAGEMIDKSRKQVSEAIDKAKEQFAGE